jgi:hypothetical protein
MPVSQPSEPGTAGVSVRHDGLVFTDPMAAGIAEFLASIGLEIAEAEVPDGSFLPGILVRDGCLLVDPAKLLYPGDLLHEAGHLAVLPPAVRVIFGGAGAAPGLDMGRLGIQAVAWSYAAALRLDLDPAVVFHDGGYGGHAAGLRRSFAFGVHYGVSDLQEAGLAAGGAEAARLGIPPYPHMIKWLRD